MHQTTTTCWPSRSNLTTTTHKLNNILTLLLSDLELGVASKMVYLDNFYIKNNFGNVDHLPRANWSMQWPRICDSRHFQEYSIQQNQMYAVKILPDLSVLFTSPGRLPEGLWIGAWCFPSGRLIFEHSRNKILTLVLGTVSKSVHIHQIL